MEQHYSVVAARRSARPLGPRRGPATELGVQFFQRYPRGFGDEVGAALEQVLGPWFTSHLVQAAADDSSCCFVNEHWLPYVGQWGVADNLRPAGKA